MPTGQWYTLVRFHGDPQHLTGVSQARTPLEALLQLERWEATYAADTTVVFDRDNRPVDRPQLEYLAAGLRAADQG
jgi:hypothetical protein